MNKNGTNIHFPIIFTQHGDSLSLSRDICTKNSDIDNLIDLIIFTHKGSFSADPDFGFDYWKLEFTNTLGDGIINSYYASTSSILDREIKESCQESIKKNIETYAPELKEITVSIDEYRKLQNINGHDIYRHSICVTVSGMLENGLGTSHPYTKKTSFSIEPTFREKLF